MTAIPGDRVPPHVYPLILNGVKGLQKIMRRFGFRQETLQEEEISFLEKGRDGSG